MGEITLFGINRPNLVWVCAEGDWGSDDTYGPMVVRCTGWDSIQGEEVRRGTRPELALLVDGSLKRWLAVFLPPSLAFAPEVSSVLGL